MNYTNQQNTEFSYTVLKFLVVKEGVIISNNMCDEIDEQDNQVLQSLKEEFPSLTIAYKNGAICAHMLGF